MFECILRSAFTGRTQTNIPSICPIFSAANESDKSTPEDVRIAPKQERLFWRTVMVLASAMYRLYSPIVISPLSATSSNARPPKAIPRERRQVPSKKTPINWMMPLRRNISMLNYIDLKHCCPSAVRRSSLFNSEYFATHG